MTDRTHYCAGCKGREDIIKKLEAEKAVVADLWEQQKEIALDYLDDCNKAADHIEKLEAELMDAQADNAIGVARIEKLEADNARLNDALRQAVIDATEWARKAGEAQGKLEISEAAGILDGWIRDCKRLEADNVRLREALENILERGYVSEHIEEERPDYERARAALEGTSHD